MNWNASKLSGSANRAAVEVKETGVLEYWSENEFGSRNAEVGIAAQSAESMEWWSSGVVEYWSSGVLEYWSVNDCGFRNAECGFKKGILSRTL